MSSDEISEIGISEFDQCVEKLRNTGVEVLVMEDSKEPFTPDSIFPNNWIATLEETLMLFPMESPLRRLERSQLIIDQLKKQFVIKNTIDLTPFEQEGKFLEGTGSMVLDHKSKIIYACLSSRTNLELLQLLADEVHYLPIVFEAEDSNGRDIYHTNVMMSIGADSVVVCEESIRQNRKEVLESLNKCKREVITINYSQMNNFCANILHIKAGGLYYWIMSERAYADFTETQLAILKRSSELLVLPVNTIEKIGGGGIRCMIAEIFLKRS